MEEIPDKLFFKIGEVSSITQLEQHILRYWETEFRILHPRKNNTSQRLYNKRDVELILRIKKLLHEEGYTIQGARKKLAGKNSGRDAEPEASPPRRENLQQNLNFEEKKSGKALEEIKKDLKTVLALLSR